MTPFLVLFGMLNNYIPCQTVERARIFGDDLARAVPAFAGMPRDAVVENSPAPGVRRSFSSAELERIGRRFGVSIPLSSSACFEWELRPLEAGAVTAAMRESLQAPRARVDILAMTGAPAPVGKLVFPIAGLADSRVDAATPVTWKGYVAYGESGRFGVWARVRVSTTTTRVVATETLLPEQTVAPQQVRIETYDDFPLQHDVVRNIDEVIGRVIRRPIRAGVPILRTDLEEPLLVRRGDMVDVTVISGLAQVHLEALADVSGRQGDMISCTNPRTGTVFRARIQAKGRAVVVARPLASIARVQ